MAYNRQFADRLFGVFDLCMVRAAELGCAFAEYIDKVSTDQNERQIIDERYRRMTSDTWEKLWATEYRLFAAHDIETTEEAHERLLFRAGYHEKLAADADELELAAMHERIATQLRGFATRATPSAEESSGISADEMVDALERARTVIREPPELEGDPQPIGYVILDSTGRQVARG